MDRLAIQFAPTGSNLERWSIRRKLLLLRALMVRIADENADFRVTIFIVVVSVRIDQVNMDRSIDLYYATC
jgi:hypothetical protein